MTTNQGTDRQSSSLSIDEAALPGVTRAPRGLRRERLAALVAAPALSLALLATPATATPAVDNHGGTYAATREGVQEQRPACGRADTYCIKRRTHHKGRVLNRAYNRHKMGATHGHRFNQRFKDKVFNAVQRRHIIPPPHRSSMSAAERAALAERVGGYRWSGWGDYWEWTLDAMKCQVATGYLPGHDPDDRWAASCDEQKENAYIWKEPARVTAVCGGTGLLMFFATPAGGMAARGAISAASAGGVGLGGALTCSYGMAADNAFR